IEIAVMLRVQRVVAVLEEIVAGAQILFADDFCVGIKEQVGQFGFVKTRRYGLIHHAVFVVSPVG
ncbi:MAG: hypothetical protein IKJ56_03885, partial [Bacteroidales bacterium]|nr:hypothetical protein [Bacteroidales bacterium]